ncbi:MAG: hypothetical protein LBJ57_02470 [Prevotellaceae bacterium]|jgi:hypothetical protein|nr:hypothetical protein [Prevotellaceae bacterium]
MAATILESAPAVHAAFNPTRVALSKESGDGYASAALRVAASDGSADIRFERDFIGNRATFYIDGLLSKLFREGATPIVDTRVVADALLAASYTLQVLSPITSSSVARTALNAVVQAGESFDFAPYRGKFLTRARYLQKYAGYPLSVAALSFPASSTYVSFNGGAVNGITISAPHFVVNIPDDALRVLLSKSQLAGNLLEANGGELITTNSGEVVELWPLLTDGSITPLQVVPSCTPNSPLYVRWVNKLGGYDHFMFKQRQTVKQELKNVQLSAPFVTDSAAFERSEEVYSYEADNTVVAGAENVNRYEFDVLRGLLTSPRMWWYREDLQRWIRIYIAKGSTQENTRQSMQSVEFEFVLPEQNVQI